MSYGPNLSERTNPSTARWEQSIEGFGKSIRVAIPGVIESFDVEKQTVTVQPAITELVKIISVPDGNGVWTNQRIVMPLPPLEDVPIVLPRAGGFTLTLPVQKGDECLVVFSDMCIDSWWQSGGINNNQLEQRRHDLSDGFAFLGPWSQQRLLSNYSTTAAQLRTDDGSVSVEVGTDEVTVTAQTVNVNATGTATVQGATVNVTGSTTVTISGNNTTHVDGKDFLLHTHSGVTTGSGVSGPVV